MKTKVEETQALTDLLKECSTQMEALVAKQEAAAIAAKNIARELDELRIKFRAAAEKIRILAAEEAGLDMWENIGDGG